MSPQDTIVAIATPMASSALGIVRLSGPQALDLARLLAAWPPSFSITPRHAHTVNLYDRGGEGIDQAVLTFFQGPKSFTGEDMVELCCHGNPILLQEIVKSILAYGASIRNEGGFSQIRLAEPGEFSKRAFLNGKIDLLQAEAIADLIHAHSKEACQAALRSLEGDFSEKILAMQKSLLHLRMYIEAALDFTEEEIEFLQEHAVHEGLLELQEQVVSILKAASCGKLLKEGIKIVIAGRPNAGKSSLLNVLSGEERAIVAPVAGTTRDVVKEIIHIEGLPIYLCDTAGLHESIDWIEQEAMRRTWLEIEKADHILWIEDLTALQNARNELFTKLLGLNKPFTVIRNKIDLIGQSPRKIEEEGEVRIYLSAHLKAGIDLLRERLKEMAGFAPQEGVFLARERHLGALREAQSLLTQSLAVFPQALERVAEDLREVHEALGLILGQSREEQLQDVLHCIFSQFCIGK